MMRHTRTILGDPSRGECNPYKLKDGTPLSFTSFRRLVVDGKFSQKTEDRPKFELAIVFGSGRYHKGARQAGLVSDTLFVPEIISKFQKELGTGTDFVANSYLDIDIMAGGKFPSAVTQSCNLVLSGTGDTNCFTAAVFETYEKRGRKLKIRTVEPYYSSELVGLNERGGEVVFGGPANPNLGMLTLCANPWSQASRFIALAGGIEPIGTVAALRAFLDCLTDPSPIPDNKYEEGLPAILVVGNSAEYDEEKLLRSDELTPPLNVRNLTQKHPYTIVQ
jgi:hypothetical protein